MKRKIFSFALFVIILLIPITPYAQYEVTRKPVEDIVKTFNKIERELGLNGPVKYNDYYIKQYIGLKNNEKLFLEEKTDNIYYQIMATYLSFLGGFKEALIYSDKKGNNTNNYSASDSVYFMSLKKADAVESISKMADTTRIVMINEAHHVSQHRILTAKLLKVLYDKGFRYFCAETLNNSDSLRDENLNNRKYPVMETGFYTLEPLYGDLIRQAIRIGFKIVPYESPYWSKNREVEQAENIFKIFQNDPDAKVFVHCGYGHITPSWMAGEFKRISGIRPLTIDQTEMMESSNPEYSDKFFQLACKSYLLEKPIIFIDSIGRAALTYNRSYDVVVMNPQTKYINGRPDWMLMDGNRKIFNLKQFNMDSVFCVQAIYANEDIDTAIPIDQILINNDDPVLFLPKGDFNLKFYNSNGLLVEKKEISVK
ncbi:MAG: hypothetical protein PHN88_01165 [Ignavibacteria bacterium]|nr:hypothetical protein [Ignavibacteria bacterium]